MTHQYQTRAKASPVYDLDKDKNMGPQIIQIQKMSFPCPHQSLLSILKQLSIANPNQNFVSELCG